MKEFVEHNLLRDLESFVDKEEQIAELVAFVIETACIVLKTGLNVRGDLEPKGGLI